MCAPHRTAGAAGCTRRGSQGWEDDQHETIPRFGHTHAADAPHGAAESTQRPAGSSTKKTNPLHGRRPQRGHSRLLRRLLGLEPGHHLSQALAGGLDGVVQVGLVEALEVLHPALVLGAPLLGELAACDLAEDLLHLRLGLRVDEARAAGEVAVLGGVADAVAHVIEAALVDEVDDQLHLVDALEVGPVSYT